MAGSARRFAQLLTEAIQQIHRREGKPIQVIQDELGYALGRAGGSVIEYWRKGHLPPAHQDIERLAEELVRRGGFDPPWLDQLLQSAGYPNPTALARRCFPPAAPVRDGAHPHAGMAPPLAAHAAHQPLAPFVVGPPITHPSQFFGRDAELHAIFELWRHYPLQNVAIIGRRRSGKTSLLHYLATITRMPAGTVRPGQRTDWLPHPERYQWVFVDFQDARMLQQARLLAYLLTSLMLPVPQPCDLPAFLDTVSQHLRTPAIILLDEIGAGLAAPELDQRFWWSLRALCAHQTHGNLGFVLAAHGAPAQLAQDHGKPSPFFNIFGHAFTLGPFDEGSVYALMDSSPIPFEPGDRDWILAHSGGWPYPLQMLCQLRLAALRNGDRTSAWRTAALQQLSTLSLERPQP